MDNYNLLILGAGASKPYGYPTGAELTSDIVHNYEEVLREHFRERQFSGEAIEYDLRNYREFITQFKKSDTTSIDLFISRNADKPKIADIGAFLICAFILHYEKKSKFGHAIPVKDKIFNWYTYYFNEITKNLISNSDLKYFPVNDTHIITFNYDRSLEYYLHESLINAFIQCEGDIADILNKINIFHVHGKIAPLEWENALDNLRYKAPVTNEGIKKIINNIKIIYSHRAKNEELRKIISSSVRIFFLGFSFAKENLETLCFDDAIHQNHKLYATAFGYTPGEINKLRQRIKGNKNWFKDENLIIENCDSLMLLRNYF